MSALNRAKRATFDAAFQTGKVILTLAEPIPGVGRAVTMGFGSSVFHNKPHGLENTAWGTILWSNVIAVCSEDESVQACFPYQQKNTAKTLPNGWRVVPGGRAG